MKESENKQAELDKAFENFKPNRKMRRAKVPDIPNAKLTTRRYDKVLAKHYGIPKMFRQHAKRYGLGMEYVCSTLLEHKAIEYKALPEDLTDKIYWRRK